MDRPNFYVLLGLDPSVSDRARIEEAIARKKKEWNAMRNNSLTGPSAAKYLAMLRDIEDVLMNEQSRRQEADEARRELEAKRREAADELDRDIRVLSAKGYIYEKELQGLISQYKKKGFAEKDVRGRVRVSVRPEVQVKRHIKPSMEKAIFDLIVSCLTRLNKKDLYHFLDMSPTASGKRLLDATRDLDSKERKKNPTPDVTDRLKACGFCLSVFSTDDGRQRYDNTLERQNLRGLDRILQTIALTKDGFKPKVVQELMSQACEKGVDQDEAIAYIVDFAASKNLPITDPRESLSDGLQRCGNCGVINPTKDNLCGHCGSPLQVTCPKCKTTNASERRACSKCGFTVGDFFLVNRWLGDAERAIAREDFDTAMPLLQRVDALWPGEKKTASLLAKVAERKKRIDDLHKTVLKLTNARRYEEAQRELANLQALSQANPDIGRLASEIEGARSVARQHVDVGQELQRSGDTDGALDAYAKALTACADCTDAKAGLSACPPSPPAFLYATVDTAGVSLRWAPSASQGAVKYRVQRRIGSAPRTSVDGTTVCETGATSCVDSTANSGDLYFYSVFTDRAGVRSASGAEVGPVLRVSEVGDIQKLERDRCIEITWTLPNRSTGVEIWRKPETAPSRRGDGERVPPVSPRSVIDAAVLNGRLYVYRICAIFTDASGRHVFSEGITLPAMAVEIPRPVVDLVAVPTADGFEATWSPPSAGHVWIYHNQQKPTHTPGTLLSTTDLPTLGSRVQSLSPGRAAAPVNGDRSQYKHIIPVTVNGNTAVIGRAATLSWILDVTSLHIVQDGQNLAVTWKWPLGVEAVRVVWHRDRFASGPNDASADDFEDVTQYQYNLRGGFQIACPKLPRVFVTVFAKVHDGEGWSFAAGSNSARHMVPLEMCAGLKYSVSTGLVFRSQATLILTPSRPMKLPALVLVAKSGALPTDINDGLKVLDIPDGQSCSPEKPLTRTFTTDRLPPRWKAALFPVHPELGRWMDLVQEL